VDMLHVAWPAALLAAAAIVLLTIITGIVAWKTQVSYALILVSCSRRVVC